MSTDQLPRTDRLLRLRDILAPGGPLPISRSTFYAHVKAGRIPRPVKLGKRISAWPAEAISKLVAEGCCGGACK
jgi:predicted DNA-binding transcriptional regulator AlpA